ncbi:hypothetical protein ACH5RR_026598 [Cinchona calisaya]|uniref:Uncharacterized protein n=1 Tax=Cinchona calisaya TaxID=153742 RepID=A0ABD2Z4X6_9GENT
MYQDSESSILSIVQKAIGEWLEFDEVQKSQCLGHNDETRQERVRRRWEPPNMGTTKVNIGLVISSGKSGIEIVGRDEIGLKWKVFFPVGWPIKPKLM